MELDKKTVAGAVAAVAVSAIGAAVAYNTLGDRGTDKSAKRSKSSRAAKTPPTGAININQASRDDLISLKHIGKARAKRILTSRPFKSVDELASKGLLPEDVLARHRERLTV